MSLDPQEHLDGVLDEVADERSRQDEKWGEQNHASCHAPIYTFSGPANQYGLVSEDTAKKTCARAVASNWLTWAHIAVEELAEAIDAKNETDRRAELVQLAAVVVAWIQCIDRRAESDVNDLADAYDEYEQLVDTAGQLGKDELRVMCRIADRLKMGEKQYGRLDIANDKRDWDTELANEVFDGLVYTAVKHIKAANE